MNRGPGNPHGGGKIGTDIGVMPDPSTFRLERILPGPIERVWSHLVDPAMRRRWFADGPMNLRAGGQFALHFRFADLTAEPLPQDRDAECAVTGTIIQCAPPTMLSYTWGDAAGASQVTFELTPMDDQVLLVLTHSKLPDPRTIIQVASGWRAHVAILISVLGGPKAAPFWETKRMAEDACREMLKAQ